MLNLIKQSSEISLWWFTLFNPVSLDFSVKMLKSVDNKKAPLRERKRHTARRVASTRHAVPVVGTSPVLTWDLDRGVPHPADEGTPGYPPS